MTNPGSMGQRAGQQASASASRGAQQSAARATDLTMRGGSRAGQQHYSRPRGPMGFFGAIGRLIGLVITLAVIAVAVGIFLMVLGQVQPDWFANVTSWFESTF